MLKVGFCQYELKAFRNARATLEKVVAGYPGTDAARLAAERLARMDVEKPVSRLKLTETFVSIQGEADAVGWPTLFIRLTGCPLRCVYCDTQYAFHGGEWRTVEELLEVARAQRRASRLRDRRRAAGAEGPASICSRPCATRGYRGLARDQRRDGRGAGRSAREPRRGPQDAGLRRGGAQPARRISTCSTARTRSSSSCAPAPTTSGPATCCAAARRCRARCCCRRAGARSSPRDLAEWILADRLDVRLQVQLHKVLWGNEPGR